MTIFGIVKLNGQANGLLDFIFNRWINSKLFLSMREFMKVEKIESRDNLRSYFSLKQAK